MPQGSVLGPILCVVYINDSPQVLTNHCLLFADDTKLYSCVIDDADICRMQQDIDNLVMRSEMWQLPFNVSKCKTLHLGKTTVVMFIPWPVVTLSKLVRKKTYRDHD